MLTIHGIPISVHARKVIVACRLKGLDARVEPVVPFRPPEGWAEFSPTGQIPVLTDGDFRLSDSTAICLYLERTRPQAPLLPADPQAYGRSLWFDAYAGGTLFRTLVQGLLAQLVIGPNLFDRPTDQAEVARLRGEVEPALFGYLEHEVGDGYLAGERLSLGDLAVTSNLINHRYLGFGPDAARYPKLAAYFARMTAEPAVAAALAAERPFAQQMGLKVDWVGELETA